MKNTSIQNISIQNASIPKVSICIPAYNNAASIGRLLASIEKQTYRDYEVIITDDSGGDGVGRLVQGREYVRYYKNGKRLGATANWNAAIAKSSGEYVKIMHHDDWFTDENSLQAFVDMLEQHGDAALAFSGSRQVEGDENQPQSHDRHISEGDAALIRQDYRNLYLGNTIGAPSAVIVRRSALEAGEGRDAIIYDEALTWLVDMEYYMNILKNNPRFTYTTAPLVSIGVGKGQLTERCRDDKELNVAEYGHVYEKYRLGEKKEYRKKFLHVLVDAENGSGSKNGSKNGIGSGNGSGSRTGKGKEIAASYGISPGEYRREQGRRLAGKVGWKLSHADARVLLLLLCLLFAASLVPILWLSGVNHATGDDLGYGALTHQAWITTHSMAEVFRAAAETVKTYYYGWQGTWFSVFLFTLQPEVFSPEAYVIVPFLMLALWTGSTALLGHCLLVEKGGFSTVSWGILTLLFAMAGIQFVPSTKSAIFWYNGNAHYTVPYALALLAVFLYFRFTDGGKGKGIGFYVGLNVCMALLGGVNYQAAVLVPAVMVLAAGSGWKDRGRRKRLLMCIRPLLLELAGLLVSVRAPGNRVRGGEDFGFHVSTVVETILSCFVRGAVQACRYLRLHPLLLLVFAFAAAVLWYMPDARGKRDGYRHPAVFVLSAYCVYCASFAPELYAGVEVSSGVYNINYYMFLFMVFGDLVYVEGALARRTGEKKGRTGRALFPAALAALAFLFVFRGDVRRTATFRCMDYIRSGQAADFGRQMDCHLSILLDDGIRDAVLPMVNDDQGPLMHMPVTDKPDAWTNYVTGEFYGKDSVVAVPAGVWRELQGME